MSKNLLIVGAGIYGIVAKEIAQSMGFDEIAFVDDNAKTAPDGTPVIGTAADIESLSLKFQNAVVAIGNPKIRLELIENIERHSACRIATLISPRACVSPSAQIGKGCIIEPLTVIHTKCVVGDGCLVCAGAVVNHASILEEGVQVDCNATVSGYMKVPKNTKVNCGDTYASKNQTRKGEDHV